MDRRAHLLAAVSLGAFAAALAGQAGAQERPSAPTAVAEVVVTAERRETRLQDTAIPVQALSGSRLDALGVGDTNVLQIQVPGLITSQNTGLQVNTYIRGVGNTVTGLGASNSVATYVDGVYIANSIQTAQTFDDVERVEVLKGPQATLYGRNATGGAINIISKEPSFAPSGSIEASVGNYDAYDLKGSINGAIVDGRVAARLSVMAQGHRGYATNLTLNEHPGQDQEIGARAAIKFIITDDIDLLVRADYRHLIVGDYIKNLAPNSYIYALSDIPNQYVSDPWKIRGEVPSRQNGEDKGISERLNWSSPIGKISSTTSFRRFFEGPSFSDYDNIVGTYNHVTRSEMFGDKTQSNQFFHETTLSTPESDRLSAVLGVNYFHEDTVGEIRRISNATAVGNARRELNTSAYAVFGDFRFELTPEVRLVGGLRWTREESSYSQLVRVTVQGVAPGFSANDHSWTNTSPRVGVEYRPSEGKLFYLTATSGFKSGGFNETNPLNTFNPEHIWSYEGGTKLTWLDGRLRTNASAFYYDYKDLQVSQVQPVTLARVIANAQSAKLYGLDLEVNGSVTKSLSAGVNLSLLHSEFGNLILCDSAKGPCLATPNDSGFVNVNGNTLNNAPQVAGTVFADQTFDVFGGTLTLHGDASYRSRVYFSQFERKEFQSSDPIWTANVQLRYDSQNNWYAAAYVQNLTDALYINFLTSSAIHVPATNPATAGTAIDFARFAPPRTYGLRVGYKF